ncbi:T9SS type A sorting domain-containing protein [Bacteroidia bacterium]|nr:T9SS type A sorting domain-containing protein [Bacteroidia bacterium]MDB9882962.1 T9SS type A sorting domain-containing protein [Bacteroidia bacterium]
MKRLFSIAFVVLFSTVMTFADEVNKLGQNYPNPAKEKTYVNVEFSSPEATLKLSNILGETIQVLKLPHSGTFVLDVTDIPEGVYFYTLNADGHKATKRLTVKK